MKLSSSPTPAAANLHVTAPSPAPLSSPPLSSSPLSASVTQPSYFIPSNHQNNGNSIASSTIMVKDEDMIQSPIHPGNNAVYPPYMQDQAAMAMIANANAQYHHHPPHNGNGMTTNEVIGIDSSNYNAIPGYGNPHYPPNQQYYPQPLPNNSNAYMSQQQALQYQQHQHQQQMYHQQYLYQQQQQNLSNIFDEPYLNWQHQSAPGAVSPAMFISLSPTNANTISTTATGIQGNNFYQSSHLPFPIEPLSVTEANDNLMNGEVVSHISNSDVDPNFHTSAVDMFPDNVFSFDGIKLNSPSNSQKKRRRGSKNHISIGDNVSFIEVGNDMASNHDEITSNGHKLSRASMDEDFDSDGGDNGSLHDDEDDYGDEGMVMTPGAVSEKSATDSEKKVKKNRRAAVVTSPFRGVSCCGKDKKWQVRIRDGKKALYLGRYNYEVEAALKYDEAARTLKTQVTATNFLDVVGQDAELREQILKEGVKHGYLLPDYYKYLDPGVLEKILKFSERCQNRNSKANSLASALANRDAIAVAAAAKSMPVMITNNNIGTKRDQSQINQ